MNAPPDFAVNLAVHTARQSPCGKSKRGAVVYSGAQRAVAVFGAGFNSPPGGWPCRSDVDIACRNACGKLCVHAEQRAIRRAVHARAPRTLDGLDLVHVKVVDGKLVAGGGPSCWQCSREVLDVGLAGVWLYEARPPEGMLEEWCCYTDQHSDDCPLCLGEGCERCNPGPCRPRCEHDVDERHGNLPIITAVWRYFTAADFHRITLETCRRDGKL